MPRIFSEVRPRDGGPDRQKDVGSLVDVLVDTVARMQQDLASLRAENRLLRTPAVPQVVRAPRQAAFTMTKVPRFDGTTSWEQYRQVVDAIVLSNSGATVVLPFGWGRVECGSPSATITSAIADRPGGCSYDPLWVTGSVGGLPKTVRKDNYDSGGGHVIFATALETLAVKAFGDMGQTAHLRLIRDRFIAGHGSCELRRHLDSVPPETPIRDVVDPCHIWKCHADTAARRVSKPSPDPIYPAYVVGDSDNISETTRVAAVTRLKSGPDQLEDLLRRLLTAVDTPAPIPEVPGVEKYSVWWRKHRTIRLRS